MNNKMAKKKKNQPEQNEGTRIQKNEEGLGNLWDNFKCSNIWIIGVPEGEEEEQAIENLFEKIMKENFPNLAKEKTSRKYTKFKESQRSWTQGRTHQDTSLSFPRLNIKRES